MKKHYKRIIAVCIMLMCAAGYVQSQWISSHSAHLRIDILDIGQGDAIYIRTPQGTDILIDGGPDRSVLYELGEVMPPYDHTLELVIATHPDADHIAGLTELPEGYTVQTLITNGIDRDTPFADVLAQWDERGTQVLHASRGWNLAVEDQVWLEFLHPNPNAPFAETNDNAVVFRLHYNEFTALFTGDIAAVVERELVVQLPPEMLDSDILKVAHHGSRYSSSQEFLNAVTPDIALISAGKENSYGHPHTATLIRFARANIPVLSTHDQGRIECTTDGYRFSCQ